MTSVAVVDCVALKVTRQYLRADDRSMLEARLYFVLCVGRFSHHLFCDVSQPFGTTTDDPLEADKPYVRPEDTFPVEPLAPPYTWPKPYTGSFNHSAFLDGAKHYYSTCIGPNGQLQLGPNADHATLIGISFKKPGLFLMPLQETSPANPW